MSLSTEAEIADVSLLLANYNRYSIVAVVAAAAAAPLALDFVVFVYVVFVARAVVVRIFSVRKQ